MPRIIGFNLSLLGDHALLRLAQLGSLSSFYTSCCYSWPQRCYSRLNSRHHLSSLSHCQSNCPHQSLPSKRAMSFCLSPLYSSAPCTLRCLSIQNRFRPLRQLDKSTAWSDSFLSRNCHPQGASRGQLVTRLWIDGCSVFCLFLS